jgi:hypothetical protein
MEGRGEVSGEAGSGVEGGGGKWEVSIEQSEDEEIVS